MPHQQTSGSTRADILNAIKNFASANGWTIAYDAVAASGQLGLSKGNCNIALGDGGTASETDSYHGGTITDGLIQAALATSLTPSNHSVTGHPGSVAAATGNDLAGPFSNIWLFTDSAGSYIHCVIQSASDRYSIISFGVLNSLGFTVPESAYLFTEWFTYWPTSPALSQELCNNYKAPHSLGFLWDANYQNYVVGIAYHVRIPAGVLNPAFGFTATDHIITTGIKQAFSRAANSSCPLDPFSSLGNAPTTGGAPLWPVPAIIVAGANGCHLGDLPDFRLMKLDGISPQGTFSVGSDTWQAFPFKRQDTYSSSSFGSSPTPYANTLDWGYAIKVQ